MGIASTKMNPMLNLGCGSRFHKDWVNLDLHPSSPLVTAHDIRTGLPFPNQTFSVVYHSHFLEHLHREEALSLLCECYRVLVPGGIIRVVVPDLETMARLYLQKLELALQGDESAGWDYEWMLLEMYDQAVRERSGGEMYSYLTRPSIPNLDFVLSRIGQEARDILDQSGREKPTSSVTEKLEFPIKDYLARFFKRWQKRIRRKICGSVDQQALRVGRFRSSGEVHHWMYDRYSLSRVLTQAGFNQVIQQTACTSMIENWRYYQLDCDSEGVVYKPESIFMEGVKP